MNFNQLRTRHAQFIYEGFDFLYEDGNLKITFDFLLSPDIKFKPEIILPKANVVPPNLIFNLGMVELLSYWKAACPPQIIIKAGYLNKDQISFWKNLLIKGLGEFFYTKKIDFTQPHLVEFVVDSKKKYPPFDVQLEDRDLILVGGGKDSAVTLEMVRKSGREFNCLTLNPTNAAINIAKIGGCKNPIIIKRTIDPKLLELNKKGYLNGHTPFSAYLAFLSTLAAVLYDYKNIIVSNEASADEANVEWLGQKINHQYSKTLEFENLFREYANKYLAKNINYFSFLRDKGELEIAEIFSKMPKYHKVFRSCNKRSLPANAGRGSKLGVWCGACPKCVSTYLTLYPYLGKKTKEIFGKDLLNDESSIPTVLGLLREHNTVKPFECVATTLEIKKAISMGRMRAKKDGQKIPRVLQINV